jgi:hypothetical protein
MNTLGTPLGLALAPLLSDEVGSRGSSEPDRCLGKGSGQCFLTRNSVGPSLGDHWSILAQMHSRGATSSLAYADG